MHTDSHVHDNFDENRQRGSERPKRHIIYLIPLSVPIVQTTRAILPQNSTGSHFLDPHPHTKFHANWASLQG